MPIPVSHIPFSSVQPWSGLNTTILPQAIPIGTVPMPSRVGTAAGFSGQQLVSGNRIPAQTTSPQVSFMDRLFDLLLAQVYQELMSDLLQNILDLNSPSGSQTIPNPGDPSNPVVTDRPPGQEIPDIDFRTLSDQQRTDLSGLTDRDRAVLHLWGRQMIAKGHQDGGILLTVQEQVEKGKTDGSVVVRQAEVDLANELIAKDTERFGGITGRSLDEEYFKVFQKITGQDIAERYKDTPIRFADGPAKLPEQFNVDSPEWESALEAQNGMSRYENAVLRLWGHNPLFTGKIDGSILAFTINNPNSLDKGMNKEDVQVLLNADLAADGVLNGDSLEDAYFGVMDKLFFGTGGATVEKTNMDAQTRADSLGRTAQDIAISTTQGVQDAVQSVGQLFKDHPVITGLTAGGLMAATAVCPFFAGLGVAGAGIAMTQRFMDS